MSTTTTRRAALRLAHRRVVAPGVPTHLRAGRVTDTVVVLLWRAPKRGPRPHAYEILRDGHPIAVVRHGHHNDHHIRPGARYRYRVRAIGARGHRGPATHVLYVRVPRDRTPPTAPAGLTARGLDTARIALAWQPARDDVGISVYDVIRDGALVAQVVAPAFTDVGLAAGTTYTYRVAARDAAGNRSGLSAPASAATAAAPAPPAPTGARLTAAMVDRLLWRAGFGPSDADRAQWTGQPVTALVDHLLSTPQSYPPTATPPTVSGKAIDPLASADDLVMEWLYRMQTAVNPLTERLTLFWHRHFAVARSNGLPARFLLAYRNRLQRYGDLAANPTASFHDLALEMTTQDAAMSQFLTGSSNRKDHPNENYAREFMELFTLGVTDAQGNPNYTQTDVQELARAFTGWQLDQSPASPTYGQVSFQPGNFDGGKKTVLGQTGPFDAPAAVAVVLAHPNHAPFLLTKLWHEFILAPPPADALADLVATYTGSGLQLAPAVRKVLTHPLLFESLGEPNMLKPPIVYYVGLLRATGAPMRDHWALQLLTAMQQVPYDPPNVSGWEGGLSWMNTSTVSARFEAIVAAQYLQYASAPVDEGGPGESSDAAVLRAFVAVGRPWLSDGTLQALRSLAASWPADTQSRRRERQYALRALMLSGPDGQVM